MIALFVFVLLVIVPAAAALLSETSFLSRAAIRPAFGIGAPIVYSRRAISTQPVAGARDIRPSERGEFYYYNLVNYLRVTEVLDDGRVLAIACNNVRLCFSPGDSDFRKARVMERLIYRRRFPISAPEATRAV
jgi:hypothetical protein